MKKTYQKPTTMVVELSSQGCLLQNSVTSVSSNLTGDDVINYGGGGSGQARVKTNTIDWDDDWSE